MEICISGKNCIITPLSQKLDGYFSSKLGMEIKNYLMFNIGIDMSYVEDCTIDFVEEIKKTNNISLFNIQAEILSIFNVMGLDKSANLYNTIDDFKEGKYKLLNRRFKIV